LSRGRCCFKSVLGNLLQCGGLIFHFWLTWFYMLSFRGWQHPIAIRFRFSDRLLESWRNNLEPEYYLNLNDGAGSELHEHVVSAGSRTAFQGTEELRAEGIAHECALDWRQAKKSAHQASA
jgi:hypothetical protein